MKVFCIFVLQSVLYIYNNCEYNWHFIIDGVWGAHLLHLNLKLTSRISPMIEFVELCFTTEEDRVFSLMQADGPLFTSFNIAG